MSEMDLTAAESKAVYEEIKDYELEHTGLKVSSLSKSENSRQLKCPSKKEVAIREALNRNYKHVDGIFHLRV